MGIGVDFGRNDFDVSVVYTGGPSTNQKAEILAAIHALEMVEGLVDSGFHSERIESVTIKTDSQYVVHTMTDWIKQWRSNGYHSWNGQPVANKLLFRRLDDCVFALNDKDVVVIFCHVPRECNRKADFLANLALDYGGYY